MKRIIVILMMLLMAPIAFAEGIDPLRRFVCVEEVTQNVGIVSTELNFSEYGYIYVYPLNGSIRISSLGSTVNCTDYPEYMVGSYASLGWKDARDKITAISCIGTVKTYICVMRYEEGHQ